MFNKKQIFTAILKNLAKAASAAIIAVIIAVIFSGQIAKIGETLAEKKKLSAILEKRSDTAVKIEENFKIIGPNEIKIQNALLPADNILEFVGFLESLAGQTSVSQNFGFSTPTVLPQSEENISLAIINYNLNIGANIFILINYLNGFEGAPYFTDISGINISAPNGLESDFNATMSAKLYAKTVQ